jgi:hypothetical protein
MSDTLMDGTIKVAWVTSIANIHAPTAAECNAGKDFTDRITPDGLKVPPTTADVDNSSLASTFTTNTVGRRSFQNAITVKRGSTPTEELPYTTLYYKVIGYLVVRRNTDWSAAFAAGDTVEVYPSICGEPMHVDPTPNSVGKMTVEFKNNAEPDTRATVAA